MTIQPGAVIGPYTVVSPLGSGGMGEVFRARDARLDREVALKVLPDAFARDPERLARFRREANLLASLSHPNIAVIHGIEEANGVPAIVLELVEGRTLAERVARGPLPLEEVLAVAIQVASALEAAHERGVVHRDLKPANVMVRPDGMIKVLDFGLARAFSPPDEVDISRGPTARMGMTREGAVVGTPAYMSPEQAHGQPADRRTDVWAFGCLLYELLAGRRAFQGRSVSDTIAAVVRDDPDWTALPAETPAAVRRLLRRCLERDVRRRLRDIGDARIELEDVAKGAPPEAASVVPAAASGRPRRLALLGTLFLFSVLAGFLGAWAFLHPTPARVTRFVVAPPANAPVSPPWVAISPDGRSIAWSSDQEEKISVQALDALAPTSLTGLGTPTQPSFSPDGRWIAYADRLDSLRKVPAAGGPAETIAQLGGTALWGVSWMQDGTIIFGTDDPATGLWRVPNSGGGPELLTRPEPGTDHVWPESLPGGRAVLLTVTKRAPGQLTETAVLDLESRSLRRLFPGSHARYVSTGHLVYGASGGLYAVRFDLSRLAVAGVPVQVLEKVVIRPNGGLCVGIGRDGTLAYLRNVTSEEERLLVWVDRNGREEPVGAPLGNYVIPRLAPGGATLALDARIPLPNIWLWDVRRVAMTRLTFGVEAYPVWSPDGKHVAFTSFEPSTGVGQLWWRAADGATPPELLAAGDRNRYASSFTPDGTRLLYREESEGTGLDIGMVTLGSDPRIAPLVRTPANELNPEISPDGRWLAYESNESGRSEVYVRPFPNVDAGLWQVSSGGGVTPAWCSGGRELLFISPGGFIMSAAIEAGPSFALGAPARVLSASPYRLGMPYRGFDVTPDGRRFLLVRGARQSADAEIVVVLNWFEELKRLAP